MLQADLDRGKYFARPSEPKRDWCVVSYYAPGYEGESPAIGNELQKLYASEAMQEDSLVMIHGVLQEAEEADPALNLYRIYVVEKHELRFTGPEVFPIGSKEQKPWVIGGERGKWGTGQWLFDHWTGVLTARDAEYSIDPGCPLYLQAIAENWPWQVHFAKVKELICPKEVAGFIASTEGAIISSPPWEAESSAATVRYFLGQQKHAAEMQALKDQHAAEVEALRAEIVAGAARTEELLRVIHSVGKLFGNMLTKDHRRPIAQLLDQRSNSLLHGLGLQLAEDVWAGWSECFYADQEGLREFSDNMNPVDRPRSLAK